MSLIENEKFKIPTEQFRFKNWKQYFHCELFSYDFSGSELTDEEEWKWAGRNRPSSDSHNTHSFLPCNIIILFLPLSNSNVFLSFWVTYFIFLYSDNSTLYPYQFMISVYIFWVVFSLTWPEWWYFILMSIFINHNRISN